MAGTSKHKWHFKARFRRRAFGWRSQPAVKRVKEAVTEITRVARADALLGAEGAVAFIERISPALEEVDSSSGAIGSAVNRAIDKLVPIIANAPADTAMRQAWLERLFEALQQDHIPYIEYLGDRWGELCGSPEIAGQWADQLIGITKMAWSPDPDLRGFFSGATACLSALLAAGRYDELLEVLELQSSRMWSYRRYGVRALAARGDTAAAIEYAESGRDSRSESPGAIAHICEEILLSAGLVDQAFESYAVDANRAGTNLAWFRALAKKYPKRSRSEILSLLVAATPGDDGKWFAAAKDAGLLDEALDLASRAPCDPRTLTRAARDFAVEQPVFAANAGILALHWIAQGYGYEITTGDVRAAHLHTIEAATNGGFVDAARERIAKIADDNAPGAHFVARAIRY